VVCRARLEGVEVGEQRHSKHGAQSFGAHLRFTKPEVAECGEPLRPREWEGLEA
jgi:hypothetical protein